MKQHDIFIEKYKELESLLSIPVRDYEDSLPDADAQKMRICRMLRNYIQHNADYEKIISISPHLQAFLDSIVDKIHKESGIIKEHMISTVKYGFLSENDTLVDAAALMTKKKRCFNLVIDKNSEYIGVITKDIISDYFGTGAVTKATKISKITDSLLKPAVICILQSTPMDIVNKTLDGNNSIVLVTNGSQKIVGVYNIDKMSGQIQ